MNTKTAQNVNFKPRTENTCIMDYSSFTELEARGTIKNFAIKYVASGIENYQVGGVDFKVAAGEYLLAGFSGDVSVLIDSKTPVKGICVDLSKDILNEVLSYHLIPGINPESENLWRLMSTSEFPESKYSAPGTYLGSTLLKLQPHFVTQGVKYIQPNNETYYQIAESVVADCLPRLHVYNRIKAIKSSTRKELFRKLVKAKDQIDGDFLGYANIEKIATDNGFSEYHFFRLFKNCFEISPYQYILKKRMELAQQILKTNNYSISETAMYCGFTDIYTFSKAFKKYFGKAPSKHIFSQSSQ